MPIVLRHDGIHVSGFGECPDLEESWSSDADMPLIQATMSCASHSMQRLATQEAEADRSTARDSGTRRA